MANSIRIRFHQSMRLKPSSLALPIPQSFPSACDKEATGCKHPFFGHIMAQASHHYDYDSDVHVQHLDG